MYQIKVLYNGIWEQEKFLTGAKIYMSFKEANETKKQLQKMSVCSKYKLVKLA